MLIGSGAIPSPKMSSSGSAAAEVGPLPAAGVEAKPPVVTAPGPFGVLPDRSTSKSASALLVLADELGRSEVSGYLETLNTKSRKPLFEANK